MRAAGWQGSLRHRFLGLLTKAEARAQSLFDLRHPWLPLSRRNQQDGTTIRPTAASNQRPQDAAAQAFGAALALHGQDRLDEAAERYEAILGAYPDHVPSLCCLCLCRIHRGRLDEALRLGRRAVGLAAESVEAWYGLGNAQAAQGANQAAAASLQRMLAIRPSFAEGHDKLGTVLTALNRPEEARQCFTEALKLKPDYAEAAFHLGNVLAALPRPQEAIGSFTRAVACKPGFAEALNNLGVTMHRLGRNQEALAPLRRTLLCRQDYGEAQFNLGNVLRALGRGEEAIGRYLAAIALQPDFAKTYNNLGTALQPDDSHPDNHPGATWQPLDRTLEAAACFRRATTLVPDDAVAHNNMGVALLAAGHLDEARLAFEKAVGFAPRRGYFHRTLADAGRVTPAGLRRMEDLAEDMAALPEADQIDLHFALAKVYADDARHEASFRHLLAGNRLKRRSVAYDEAATLASFDRIRAVFTAELVAFGPEVGVPSRLPVFVVGMPRSGTTLVEQILASHPQAFGAEELPDLQRLADALDGAQAFPEVVAALPRERLRRLGAAYLDGLRARAPSAARIVDKMPANFQLIGLIALALPQARIIHVRRDPADTCLSCFSRLFVGRQPYAYDLAELGRYYRAYEGLMAHWRQVLPPGMMLEVHYEDVVADVEGQARRLLAHCGMAWDDRCLAFHQTRRLVRTASAAQVRQPLYGSSVGRWHVYRDLAQPLFDALGMSAANGERSS